jgi:chromosome segregation ATPase
LISISFQALQDKIEQREPVYDQLMKTSEQFLETTEPGDEREELNAKIDDVSQRWATVKEKTAENLAAIDEILPLAKVFRETTDVFVDWLKSAERKVETFEAPVGDQACVTRQNETAAQIDEEILGHKPEFTTLEDAGKDVTELAKRDSDKVKDEFNDVAERWEKLQIDLSEITAKLSGVATLLGEFNNRLEPIVEVIERCEDGLKSVNPVGVDVEKNQVEIQKVQV